MNTFIVKNLETNFRILFRDLFTRRENLKREAQTRVMRIMMFNIK